MDWPPEWWDYELAISPHASERMQERELSEAELRVMLDDAGECRASVAPGRFVILSRLGSDTWEIVVEPDELEEALVVVTAYRVE